jgi:hypothetical protein
VIGPSDPVEQLDVCSGLDAVSDAAACARGVKLQNLGAARTSELVALVDRCATLPGRAAMPATAGSARRPPC